MSDQLGELYVKTEEIKNKVAESGKYSIIKDNEKANEAVKRVHKKLAILGSAIKDIVNDLDDLSVGTSSSEFHV